LLHPFGKLPNSISRDTACTPDFETANDEHCVIGAVKVEKRHDVDRSCMNEQLDAFCIGRAEYFLLSGFSRFKDPCHESNQKPATTPMILNAP